MTSTDTPSRPKLRERFNDDVRALPGWQKKVLTFAIIATIAGFGGYLYSKIKADPNSWAASLSPRAVGVGTSIVVGFILGWLLRAAIKLALLIGFVITAIGGVLVYFEIVNLDLGSIKKTAGDTTEWATSQSDGAIDWVKSVLPSAGGAGFGAFMGFRRKS